MKRNPGPRRTKAHLFAVSLLMMMFAQPAPSHALAPDKSAQDRKSAERSLLLGRIDESVATLQRILNENPMDGQAHLLLCRDFYAEDRTEEAIRSCEEALHAMPHSSEAQDWMGRAYGMKADHAGPLEGFKLARKVRDAFEAAVAANPSNGAAVNDLSEYYVSAPSIVGGGFEKADALAERSAAALPQQAHRIRAIAAEKRKDFVAAEHEFQAAVDVAKRPDAWVDLGAFYARRKQEDQAVDALKHALAADRAKDAALVDAASILNDIHRESRLAGQALQQYLAGNGKTDAAPVPRVHVMLGRMLAEAGDRDGARIEFAKALELAANYEPAKRALEKK